jgi:AP endonuclease-2
LKEKVSIDGRETYISDIVNPPGMFEEGKRKEEWSTKNLLPLSGKLIPEFDRRRNIRDMFSRQPSLPSQISLAESEETELTSPSISASMPPPSLTNSFEMVPQEVGQGSSSTEPLAVASPVRSTASKRVQKPETTLPAAKRTKSGSQSAGANGSNKGQQSLKGFFQAKAVILDDSSSAKDIATASEVPPQPTSMAVATKDSQDSVNEASSAKPDGASQGETTIPPDDPNIWSTIDEASVEASRQSWGKLFSKRVSPKCEHGEPCKIMVTKKPGINCGRSFWMCARPLGPSGNKEKNTQWRCGSFIWASDWTGNGDG